MVKRHLAAKEWPDVDAYAQARSGIVDEVLGRALDSLPAGGEDQ